MSQFIEYLRSRIGSIYVWGAQGENVLAQPDPYGWILTQEKNNETNAKRAYALFKQRKQEGINPILAYDCSGLIVAFLLNVGILKGDRTAAALYSMCDIKMDNASNLMAGDFVCHYSAQKGYITHIGVYVGDGKVIEAKGRDDGVVETNIGSYSWNRFGRMPALEPYLKDEPVIFKLTSPRLRGFAVVDMQKALNSAGYTDDENKPLDADGVFGPRSAQAFGKLIKAHAAAPEPHVITICCTEPLTVSIDGEEAQIK